MPRFNCNLFYRVADAGWSERYILERDSHQDADADLQLIQTARLKATPVDVLCVGRRVSQIGIPRDGYVLRHDTALAINKGSFAAGSAAEWVNMADDAVLIHHTDLSRIFMNRRFFRGYPDSIVKSHGPSADFAAWWDSLNAVDGYLWTLINKGVLMEHFGDFGNPGYTPILISRFAGFTTRRVGRPLGLRRGRRKKKASAPIPAG